MRGLEWFINRIGKRVYRNKSKCSCDMCDHAYKEGVKIRDVVHANYLQLCQQELGLTYYETKEERDDQ